MATVKFTPTGGTAQTVENIKNASNTVLGTLAAAVTTQNKTVTPSDSVQEITADSGYDALGTVTVKAASSSPMLTTKTVTENNKTYNASDDSADGYSSVTVQIPEKTIIAKDGNITANGTYYASSDSVDGYSQFTVAVPSSGSVTPDFQFEITEDNIAGAEFDVSVTGDGIAYKVVNNYTTSGGQSDYRVLMWSAGTAKYISRGSLNSSSYANYVSHDADNNLLKLNSSKSGSACKGMIGVWYGYYA